MAAIIGSKSYAGEFAGEVKILHLTATPGSASDTITLNAADHGGVSEIVGVLGAQIKSGADANLQSLHVTFSGLVLTVVTKGGDGNAATDWTGAAIDIALLIKTTA